MPIPVQAEITVTTNVAGYTTSLVIDGLNGTAEVPIEIDCGWDHVDSNHAGKPVIVKNSSYVILKQLTACNSDGHVVSVESTCHNITLSEILAWDAGPGNYNVFGVRGTFCTTQDCAGWGEARKVYSSSQTGNDNTFIRCWGRFDKWVQQTVVENRMTFGIAYNNFRNQYTYCIGGVWNQANWNVTAVFGGDHMDGELEGDPAETTLTDCLAYSPTAQVGFWENDVTGITFTRCQDATYGQPPLFLGSRWELYEQWKLSPILDKIQLHAGVDILQTLRGLMDITGNDRSLGPYTRHSSVLMTSKRHRGAKVYYFSDSAARDIAMPTPAARMTCYNAQYGALQVYTGTRWATIGRDLLEELNPDDWWTASRGLGVIDQAAITGNWTSIGRNTTAIAAVDGPVWEESLAALNGHPAVTFDGAAHFKNASAVFTGTAGAVITMSVLTGAGYTHLSQSDEALATKYLQLFDSSGAKISLNQRSADTRDGLNATVAGSNTVKHCNIWHSTGTATSMWRNGVAQTVQVASGANNGDWWGDTADTDNTVIGGMINDSGFSAGLIGSLAEVIVIDRAVSTSRLLAAADQLMAKYGI